METVRKTTPAAVVQEYKNVLTPFGLALAQDKPPFNDVRVECAISTAVDREKQVDTIGSPTSLYLTPLARRQ